MADSEIIPADDLTTLHEIAQRVAQSSDPSDVVNTARRLQGYVAGGQLEIRLTTGSGSGSAPTWELRFADGLDPIFIPTSNGGRP